MDRPFETTAPAVSVEPAERRQPYEPPYLSSLGKLSNMTRFDVSVIVG